MWSDYFDEEKQMFKIRLSMANSFCLYTKDIEMTTEEYIENTRENRYGYTFLKYEGKTYIKHPLNGSYDQVYSQKQIDNAFDPEKYEIEKWLKQ